MQKPKTTIKRKVSKTTGIPTTSSGRKRKAQKAVTGGGCLMPVLIVLAIISTAIIAGCSMMKNNPNNNSNNQNSTAFESSDTSKATKSVDSGSKIDEAEKNIEVKAEQTETKKLCVFLKNNNTFVIDDLKLEVVFYDDNDKPIDTDSDGHDMILPGATVVSQIEAPTKYKRFETNVTVELGINSNYENHSKNIKLEYNTSDDGAIAQVTNNDSVKIDEVELKAVFYKKNKIVDVSFDEDIYDLRPGKTETVKFMCLEGFDSVEVYINQAHTFGV